MVKADGKNSNPHEHQVLVQTKAPGREEAFPPFPGKGTKSEI